MIGFWSNCLSRPFLEETERDLSVTAIALKRYSLGTKNKNLERNADGSLTLYVGAVLQDGDLLKKLGKHSVSKGCLYIKRLSDVDLPTLKKVIKAAAKK